MTDTRQHILDAARAQFADRGFYGTSIAQVVADLPVTKQTLLHHFGSKEALYGQVLEDISRELQERMDNAARAPEPEASFIAVMLSFQRDIQEDMPTTRLLMRELLDNRARAEHARRWYLRPFLQRLSALLQSAPRWQKADEASLFSAVYGLLGAANYYAVSGPTLERIMGKAAFRRVEARYADEFGELVRLRVSSGP